MQKQVFIWPSDGNSIGWTIFHRRGGYFQFPRRRKVVVFLVGELAVVL